jgi:hypothetical protein
MAEGKKVRECGRAMEEGKEERRGQRTSSVCEWEDRKPKSREQNKGTKTERKQCKDESR